MGSLMAGWDSPVLMNPDSAKLQRNKSLTREEIDSFWKGHRKIQVEFDDEQHSGDDNVKSPLSPFSPFSRDSPRRRSGSWKGDWKPSNTPPDSPAGGEKDNKNGDWWTRSPWAFLNETPTDEMMVQSSRNYKAQFQVTKMAAFANS